MRTATILLSGLAVAACGPAGPVANTAGEAEPARPQPATYVGRWAARPDLCEAGAWVFGPRHVATAGEVSCDFETVSATPSGYAVAASCIAQAPPQPSELQLTLTDPAAPQSMTVTGGPWSGPVTLIRCDVSRSSPG